MPIESDLDRAALMVDSGVDLSLTPTGVEAPLLVDDGAGGQRLPRGILESGWEPVEAGGRIELASTDPTVLAPTAELPGVVEGWRATIAGADLVVSEKPREDGTGMTLLRMQEFEP